MARAATFPIRPGLARSLRPVGTYWWDWEPNFGDLLTPWLLVRHGIAPVRREPEQAGLVAVGSILEHLPADYAGAVWGSGMIRDRPLRFERAVFYALRGQRTWANLGRPAVRALGDPGLLVGRLARRPEARTTLAIVPHLSHRHSPVFTSLARRYPREVAVVDVRSGPDPAIGAIASSTAVLTSSLHGLVVADAFGLPAAWVTPEPLLAGGAFKFHDHESVISPGASRHVRLDAEPSLGEVLAQTRPADAGLVEAAAAGLQAALREFAHDRATRLPGS